MIDLAPEDLPRCAPLGDVIGENPRLRRLPIAIGVCSLSPHSSRTSSRRTIFCIFGVQPIDDRQRAATRGHPAEQITAS